MSRIGAIAIGFCILVFAGFTVGLAQLGFDVCVPGPDTKSEEMIKVLTEESDTILKVASGLVVFAFAGLVGLKKELAPNTAARVLLLLTCTLSVLAAYSALVWRHGLAQLRLDACPANVLDLAMQIPFLGSFYAAGAAVLTLGALGGIIAFPRLTPSSHEETRR